MILYRCTRAINNMTMSKKNKPDSKGFVYSTDPSFRFESGDGEVRETLSPETQKLRIQLDAKQRAGKAVTLVTGFVGKPEDLEELGRKMKQFCGTGGSVKDGEIIIQGDQREKVRGFLAKLRYRVV
jgi:translation initiation factor 1